MSILTSRQNSRYAELLLLGALLFSFFTLGGSWLIERFSPAPAWNAPPPAPISQGADEFIWKQQDALRRNPNNTYAYAQLGLALLEKVRLTNDPLLYIQAEEAFHEALSRDPEQLDAIIGQGILALARHDFTGALGWADQAWAINSYSAETLGIKVDAQVELGMYEEAVATLQQMMDLKPGLPAYSRVSYLRELHGDVPGAIESMAQAADTAIVGSEPMLWSTVQLGHLFFNSGDLEQAEATYEKALFFRPDYLHAQAGMAKIEAARGEYDNAIAAYETVVKRQPLPAYIIALGELYEMTARPTDAERQYELVRIMQQLNAEAGMDVDLELSLFEIEYGGDLSQALAHAQATYARRPSIYAADVLAWALYHHGDYQQAETYIQEALKLGTRDALLHYHAGKIALALGKETTAHDYFQQALEINPYFSLRYASEISS